MHRRSFLRLLEGIPLVAMAVVVDPKPEVVPEPTPWPWPIPHKLNYIIGHRQFAHDRQLAQTANFTLAYGGHSPYLLA